MASVGNEYNTAKLQRAAVLHEKSLRPAWQPRKGSPGFKGGKGVKGTYLTGVDEVDENLDELQADGNDSMTEEEAILLHEAYVAQETAKARYRDVAKARGVDPGTMKDHRRGSTDEAQKQSIDDRLAHAKSRSYCAGCGRRGHWHKDSVCPLNRAGGAQQQGSTPARGQQAHVTTFVEEPSNVVQVAYEVGNLWEQKLLAITDTACSKSGMRRGWLEGYLKYTKAQGIETQFINTQDDFRFGASKLFRASYSATVTIEG